MSLSKSHSIISDFNAISSIPTDRIALQLKLGQVYAIQFQAGCILVLIEIFFASTEEILVLQKGHLVYIVVLLCNKVL